VSSEDIRPRQRPIPCTRQCLRCDKPFLSRDKKKNWICDKCLHNRETAGVMDDVSVSSIPRSGQ
jgi:ribosomal protein L37AE/L43A